MKIRNDILAPTNSLIQLFRVLTIVEHGQNGWFLLHCHPEYAPFMFSKMEDIHHNDLSIKLSFNCSMFFRAELQKNSHKLADENLLICKQKKIYLRV